MSKVHHRWFFPGLLLFAVLVYLPGLSGPFIFDDAAAISANHHLAIDASIFDEWRTAAVSSNSGQLRRPVAMWSFTVNQVIAGGPSAYGIKLGNLLIHLLCGLLVYQLAKTLLCLQGSAVDGRGVFPAALFAAAIWVLHPLHVSTVLYAVQRMAQLSTLFCLCGLLVYVRYRKKWAEVGAPAGEIIATGLWALFFMLLAVLSKENGLLLLWLIPVVEVTLFRGRWAGTRNPLVVRVGWLLFFTPLLALGLLLIEFPQRLIGGYASREFSLEERVLTQARLLWTYLQWLVIPDIDAMGFQHDDIQISHSLLQPATTVLSIVAWIAALVIGFLWRERYPLFLFALLFYLVGHSMESGFIPLEMVYEHRSYLPSAAVSILLSCVLLRAFSILPRIRPRVFMLSLAIALGSLTFLRASVWADEETLTLMNVSNHPRSARSQFFYANHKIRKFEETVDVDQSRAWEYLIAARTHMELAHQARPGNFPALVILYWLDSHYFTDLKQQTDWLDKLDVLSQSIPLYASVHMSLETLVDCFADRLCDDPPERLFDIIGAFERRFPRNPSFALLRYRYLQRTDAAFESRLVELDRAELLSPYTTRIYRRRVMERSGAGDVAGMYDTVKRWLAHDPHRRELQDIKSMFATAPDPGQPQ